MGKRRQARAGLLGSAWIGTALWMVPVGMVAMAPQVAQAQQTYNFDVPAQPVMHAVNQIGRVGGFSVVFSGNGDGLVSAPVTGSLTREEALGLALVGTGLTYDFTGANTVTVSMLEPFDVEGENGAGELLGTIVLTASGYEQQIDDAPATITVVDPVEFVNRPYETVADALQDKPGVFIENSGELNGGSVTIRGMTEDYVLFMVDGKPLGSSQEAFYNGWGTGQKSGYLPPASAIERIEVIRGPMSSLYGTDAAGGVVNVITKPVTDEWTGTLSVGVTIQQDSKAGGQQQADYYLAGPLVKDRLGLALYGRVYNRQEDQFLDGFPSGSRLNQGGRLSWVMTETQTLEFDASVSSQDYGRTPDTTGSDDGSVQNLQHSYALTHRVEWQPGLETTTYLMSETVDIENNDYTSVYENLSFNTSTIMETRNNMLTFGFNLRDERTKHDEARFDGSVATDLSRWQYALFAEDELTLTDDFTVTMGARWDNNENYGSHFTPRLYGVYHASPTLTLKGGVSGGYKVPELKQADSNIIEPAGRGAGWDQGNTDLKPETSTNYELGMVWTGYSGVQAGLTAYYTEFRNKIERQEICSTPDGQAPSCSYNGQSREWIRQYVNQDRARLHGLEATLDFWLGEVDVSMNYTYSDSEITSGEDAGQPFNELPLHMANLNMGWQATDKLGTWGRVRYRSETNASETDRVPSYTIVDLGLTYDFKDNVQGAFGIYNVLDKQIDSSTYGKALDGRQFYVGLTSSF
ncbi:TonB-dependent receptor domain-containing protein [Marinibacterium sp. SX1]|uniref:TonB-dependent receptor n=1 Tax=Marinibacterium sp. SX1 TaxID=3388424 RepID=UPI003D17269D